MILLIPTKEDSGDELELRIVRGKARQLHSVIWCWNTTRMLKGIFIRARREESGVKETLGRL